MSNCQAYESLIHLHLDRMLEPSEEQVLTEHLAACPACREKLAQYRRMQQALAELKDEPLPAGLHDSILAYVAAQENGKAPGREPSKAKRFPSWIWKTVAGVAACAVIAFAAPQVLPHKQSADTPMAEASAGVDEMSGAGVRAAAPVKPSAMPDTVADGAMDSVILEPANKAIFYHTSGPVTLYDFQKAVAEAADTRIGYLVMGWEQSLPGWMDKTQFSSLNQSDGPSDYVYAPASEEYVWIAALETNGFTLYALDQVGEAPLRETDEREAQPEEKTVLFLFQWEKSNE